MSYTDNTDITQGFILRQSPSGKPEFAVQFDCKDFKPEEVKVSTKDGKLLITGECKTVCELLAVRNHQYDHWYMRVS